ncbi:MAG: SpoVA/SpoVAEb family sporulation membrane protein [Bacilli bacterium]
MNKEEYNELVKETMPKERSLYNSIIAFVIGGLVGVFGTLIHEILTNTYGLSSETALIWVAVIIIGISSLLTGLGFFDSMMTFSKCGLLIPISGFAHSMTSSTIEYKKEGLITGMGANIFKLAGSVLLYGIYSAFIFALIKVVLFR